MVNEEVENIETGEPLKNWNNLGEVEAGLEQEKVKIETSVSLNEMNKQIAEQFTRARFVNMRPTTRINKNVLSEYVTSTFSGKEWIDKNMSIEKTFLFGLKQLKEIELDGKKIDLTTINDTYLGVKILLRYLGYHGMNNTPLNTVITSVSPDKQPSTADSKSYRDSYAKFFAEQKDVCMALFRFQNDKDSAYVTGGRYLADGIIWWYTLKGLLQDALKKSTPVAIAEPIASPVVSPSAESTDSRIETPDGGQIYERADGTIIVYDKNKNIVKKMYDKWWLLEKIEDGKTYTYLNGWRLPHESDFFSATAAETPVDSLIDFDDAQAAGLQNLDEKSGKYVSRFLNDFWDIGYGDQKYEDQDLPTYPEDQREVDIVKTYTLNILKQFDRMIGELQNGLFVNGKYVAINKQKILNSIVLWKLDIDVNIDGKPYNLNFDVWPKWLRKAQKKLYLTDRSWRMKNKIDFFPIGALNNEKNTWLFSLKTADVNHNPWTIDLLVKNDNMEELMRKWSFQQAKLDYL